jgi:hypothetical protein
MQQLLEMGELGVVERCELAARLLLSLRDGLVPRSQQPVMDGGCGWWQVQVWEVPRGAQSGNEQQNLQSQLGTFLKTFFQLAGQVRPGSTWCLTAISYSKSVQLQKVALNASSLLLVTVPCRQPARHIKKPYVSPT